jgi:hypothetical protein
VIPARTGIGGGAVPAVCLSRWRGGGGILRIGLMTDRRRFAPVVVLMLFGILSLTSVMTRPQFAGYRGPDVLQIFGSGMCFGAAIVSLVIFIRERRSR